MAVMPFSAPYCASIALLSVIEDATPEGRPSQLDTCAEAALSTADSPLPPEKAPVRRSITSGQLENIIGWPGLMACTITKLASVSASDCARNPANVAGAVAPACAAVMQEIGILLAIQPNTTSTASSANRMGEMTGLICAFKNGRFEKAPSPPAAISSI